MPRGSPFTRLCSQFAGLEGPRGADLHVHTLASDGAFTSSQVVAFAKQAKLKAIAITDHDTIDGLKDAHRTAAEMPSPTVEVVAGVEITTTFQGRELHLLGYFFREDHAGLQSLLGRSCELRRQRFQGFVERLASQGVTIPPESITALKQVSSSLGRRHLASLLVRSGQARSHHEAWHRFVGPGTRGVPSPEWPGIEEAIAALRDAGGVPSLAHPPDFLEEGDFETLKQAGLLALEVVYPWSRSAIGSRLRAIASRLELLTTGGSDCHGATPAHRMIGSYTVSGKELDRLRDHAKVGVAS